MSSDNQSFISVAKINKNIVSWKRSKGLGINLIGLSLIICSLVTFSISVVLLMGIFLSNYLPSKEIVLGIPIIMNVLIILLDIISVLVVYIQPGVEGYQRVQSIQELTSKAKQVILLVALIIIFSLVAYIYWVPTLSFSNIVSTLASIGILIFCFFWQFVTIGFAMFGLILVRENEIITIHYDTKQITNQKVGILKKTVQSMSFEELTSLIIRPIVDSPRNLWELVLMCQDQPFQIFSATKDIVQVYASPMQQLLQLSLEIAND